MQASQYDPTFAGYMKKASRLLRQDLLAAEFNCGYGRYGRLERDGEWVRLGRVDNVGVKFLRWMVENNFLERRNCGNSYGSLIHDWYRLKVAAEVGLEDDLGDLWVPG